MKLQNQLTNLELSKRLEKLNCKQDSFWYWIDIEMNGKFVIDNINFLDKGTKKDGQKKGYCYSAFTVAELGEILPGICWTRKTHSEIKEDFVCYNDIQVNRRQLADTEADARAKMLIYLIENKLIKP